MAHFQSPQDEHLEKALYQLIRSQLSLSGIDAGVEMLRRVRQQVSVARFLDEIVAAGRRNASSDLAVIDVSLEQRKAPDSDVDADEVSALAETTPEVQSEASATNVEGSVEPACDGCPDGEGGTRDTTVATQGQEATGQSMYRLLVPNATADVAYDHALDLSHEPLAAYRIHSIAGLESIGLAFDPAIHRLHGMPCAEPGKASQLELDVVLERRDNPLARATAKLSLFINPHPRTLWKRIEPDAALEHRKEHRRSLCEAGPPLVLAASVRGRSHENSGSFREDDFHVGRDAAGKWTVVAVSDGAGSAKLSRLGSGIATETSVASLLSTLEREDDGIEAVLAEAASIEEPDRRVAKMEEVGREVLLEPVGRAAFEASRAIQAKAAELGVEEKALAATLMFAVLRRVGDDVLVASYWIGDGAATLLDPATGLFHLLGEADSGEYSGQTRFLLSQEFPREAAWEAIGKRFRCHCVPASAVLLLMTDGVSDPKFGTDNALRDPARWLSFWNDDLASQLPLSEPHPELDGELPVSKKWPEGEDYLQFWSQGEHDDRTLALVRWP